MGPVVERAQFASTMCTKCTMQSCHGSTTGPIATSPPRHRCPHWDGALTLLPHWEGALTLLPYWEGALTFLAEKKCILRPISLHNRGARKMSHVCPNCSLRWQNVALGYMMIYSLFRCTPPPPSASASAVPPQSQESKCGAWVHDDL